jgi:hypothetical protein
VVKLALALALTLTLMLDNFGRAKELKILALVDLRDFEAAPR